MPFNIGPGELILVLVIALLVVGPGKLPDVGAAIGKSLREFRRAASDVNDAASVPASSSVPSSSTPPPNVLASPATPNVLGSDTPTGSAAGMAGEPDGTARDRSAS
jgi:sec-independent protein translocase protein TatA